MASTPRPYFKIVMAGLVPATQKRRRSQNESARRRSGPSPTASVSGWPGQARPWR